MRLELWHLLIILLIAAGVAVVVIVARVVRGAGPETPVTVLGTAG